MIGRILSSLRWDDRLGASQLFIELLHRHALDGLDRQLWLDRLAGDADWWIDQATGLLTLGDRLTVPIQFAGSEADRPRTWKWSWANPSVDERLTTVVHELRQRGERESIPELSAPEFRLRGPMAGHAMAIVATGAAGLDAYYRAPYPGGAVFVMLTLPEDRRQPDLEPFDRAFAALSIAPAALPIPLRLDSVRGFLESLTLAVEETPNGVRAGRDNRYLRVTFDRVGRMSGVAME